MVPATQAAYDAMLTAAAPELTEAELTTLRSLSFGDNAETGTGGSGVFTYAAGSGAFEIKETAGAGNATTAILVLGAGIDAAQLAATADAQGDLLVTDGIAGDQIKLDWMMLPGANGVSAFGVQTVRFADGTTWTAEPFVGGSAARRGGEGRAGTPCNVGRWWWAGRGVGGCGWSGRRAGLVRRRPPLSPIDPLRGSSPRKGGGRRWRSGPLQGGPASEALGDRTGGHDGTWQPRLVPSDRLGLCRLRS